jgi:iron complex outermembrane receptor protein
MLTWSKVALGLSSAVALVHATPVFAQAQRGGAASSDNTLGEVIVTARRVEERLQDVPISVTVFNQAQITKQNIVNLSDLATYTPSLGTTNVLGNSQTTFSLRGFNQELTTSATVGVFFADVVAPRGASNQQPVGDGAGPGAFFDLQNVQILKGPQGTLFGRNTTGGAILLVPMKPTANKEGYIEASYGNDNMWRLQGVFNTPIGDTMRLRLGFDRMSRDGYVKNNTNIGPDKLNDVNYVAARASLLWDVTPEIENYSILTYALSKTVGEINSIVGVNPVTFVNVPGVGTLPFSNGSLPNGIFAYLTQQEQLRYAGKDFYSTENNKPNPDSNLEQWQGINTTTWRANENLTVKNIISYAQLHYDLNTAVFGTAWDLSDLNPYGQALMNALVNPALRAAGLPPATFQPYPQGTILNFTEATPEGVGHTAQESTFTEEFQLQGNALDNKLQYQTGVYYEYARPLGPAGSLSGNLTRCATHDPLICANPLFGFGSVGFTEAQKTISTKGVYGQASYDLTSQLKFTGGIRYTWDHQEATGALINYKVLYNPFAVQPVFVPGSNPTCVIPTASLAKNCIETVGQDSNAPTWLLDLDYKPTENILTYVKYSRGYRTGGISFQLPSSLRTYGPEKVNAYEVGLKLTNPGNLRGVFNVAAFYNDFNNQQIPIGVQPKVAGSAAAATGVVNAGKSRIYGVEVESSLELFRGFIASLSYSYLNTKIEQLVYPAFSDPIYFLNVATSPHVGDQLSYAPKHKLSISGTYTLPLDESIGRIALGATFTYIDPQISSYSFRDASGRLNGLSYLGARQLLDLNVTWTDVAGRPVDVQLFANNVTEKHYTTYLLAGDTGFQLSQLGLPRLFGVRLKYRFGP